MTLNLKGFELSTDYEKLWLLINDGYIIPAWVLYKETHWDIVQVKTVHENSTYVVGSRGRGFEGITLDSFIKSCTSFELHYAIPS